MSSLEKVWEYREEQLYPRLFGQPGRGIFPLDLELFSEVFGNQAVDPRWLHLGVFEFPPTNTRNSWLYVTSGGSTPWELAPIDYNPVEYSWLGVEFVMEVYEQADWPIQVLRRLLAYHVLVCHGRFGDMAPLDYGHRVPAGGAIDGSDDSKLRFLAIAKPNHYDASAQLDSGRFDFLHVVGISESERDFAKSTSTEALITALHLHKAYPVTASKRAPIPL
ncbi:suppressor of fused domain protein [Collimonas pratensis]|uniref:suppressor of fused domain protein n=1 Tax=Collimonas pratensis TaxID=279113 RepID=UPI000AB6711A|nr:suppressor of fused domain protein [Collimonas pratensis]